MKQPFDFLISTFPVSKKLIGHNLKQLAISMLQYCDTFNCFKSPGPVVDFHNRVGN